MLKNTFKIILLCTLIFTPKLLIAEPHYSSQLVLTRLGYLQDGNLLPQNVESPTLQTNAEDVEMVNLTPDDLKSPGKIPETQLRNYLENNNSPLAPYAGLILQSDFWATIVGICSVEQYGCSKAPNWNFWGLMKTTGGLQRFATPQEGINAISSYLQMRYSQGRTTFKSFRGYYCVNRAYPGNICPGWEQHVKMVKGQLEG